MGALYFEGKEGNICSFYIAFDILLIQVFVWQALAFQNSGTKLGVLKSANESLTRVVVYVSLMALYVLGGSKVNAVSL